MERNDATPGNGLILERIDTVQMGAYEREQARDLVAKAERIADLVIAIAAAGRRFAARVKSALQPRAAARYRSADAR